MLGIKLVCVCVCVCVCVGGGGGGGWGWVGGGGGGGVANMGWGLGSNMTYGQYNMRKYHERQSQCQAVYLVVFYNRNSPGTLLTANCKEVSLSFHGSHYIFAGHISFKMDDNFPFDIITLRESIRRLWDNLFHATKMRCLFQLIVCKSFCWRVLSRIICNWFHGMSFLTE